MSKIGLRPSYPHPKGMEGKRVSDQIKPLPSEITWNLPCSFQPKGRLYLLKEVLLVRVIREGGRERSCEGGVEENWRVYPTSTVFKTHRSEVVQNQALRKQDRLFAKVGEYGFGVTENGMATSTGPSK